MSKIGNYVVGLQEQEIFIECPECKDTDRQGKVTGEEFKWTGDMYEPFETWVDCENCNGLGEIERDFDYDSCGQ